MKLLNCVLPVPRSSSKWIQFLVDPANQNLPSPNVPYLDIPSGLMPDLKGTRHVPVTKPLWDTHSGATDLFASNPLVSFCSDSLMGRYALSSNIGFA
jgi:hypothetical protein